MYHEWLLILYGTLIYDNPVGRVGLMQSRQENPAPGILGTG